MTRVGGPTDPVGPLERRQYDETIDLLARQHLELVAEDREDAHPRGIDGIAGRFMVPTVMIRRDYLARATRITGG